MVHAATFAPFDLVVAAPHGVQEGKVAACLLAALIVGLRPAAGPDGGRLRGLALAACACSLLAVACSYGPMGVGKGPELLSCSFALAEGAGGALATLLFLTALCSFGPRVALVAIPVAIALSHALFTMASVLPAHVGVWAKPVFLVCSLGVLLGCWFGKTSAVLASHAERRRNQPPAGGCDRACGALRPSNALGFSRSAVLAVVGCVALPFVYVLVSRMVIADIYAADLYEPAQEVALVVIMLGIAAYVLLSKRGERGDGIELAVIVCDVAFATALLFLALFGSGTLALVGALVQGGFFVFNALLWMFVAHESAGDVRRAAVLFGVVDATLYLFAMVGRIAGRYLMAAGDALFTALFLGIWVLAMLLLVMFLVERRRAVTAPEPVAPAEVDVLVSSCDALARAHGLSEREAQVMLAFARGRSASRIAEEFGISQETVKTHVKHVYTKVGVHSRQELLDALERAAG